MKRIFFIALLLIAVSIYYIPALDIEGQWEFHSAFVAIERSIAKEMGLGDEALIEQNSLLYYDGEGESVVFSIIPETNTLIWQGEKVTYRRKGDAYSAQPDDGSLELLFSTLGEEIFCQINYRSDYGRYILVGEIRKPGEPSKGGSNTSLDLAGKRFVNSSLDVELEFRETMVNISLMGMQAGSFKYEQEGNYIYIFDPDKGAIEFEIVEDNRLYTDAYGLSGYYNRE